MPSQAGGEIQLTKSEIEANAAQGILRGAFVRGEIEQREGRFGIAGEGHAVSGGEAVEQGAGGVEVRVLEEIDGRARFDEEQDLRGIIHGSEFGDGLLDPVIENVEVFPMQAFDEFAAHVGDDDADIDAFDGEADGWGRGEWRFLGAKREFREQKDQQEKQEQSDWDGTRFVWLVLRRNNRHL